MEKSEDRSLKGKLEERRDGNKINNECRAYEGKRKRKDNDERRMDIRGKNGGRE